MCAAVLSSVIVVRVPGVGAITLLVFLLVAALVMTAAIGTWISVRAATRIEPVRALRAE